MSSRTSEMSVTMRALPGICVVLCAMTAFAAPDNVTESPGGTKGNSPTSDVESPFELEGPSVDSFPRLRPDSPPPIYDNLASAPDWRALISLYNQSARHCDGDEYIVTTCLSREVCHCLRSRSHAAFTREAHIVGMPISASAPTGSTATPLSGADVR